jgi:hypothetical protein
MKILTGPATGQEKQQIQEYIKRRNRQGRYYWERGNVPPLNSFGAGERLEWRGNPSYDKDDYKLGGRLHGPGIGPDSDE